MHADHGKRQSQSKLSGSFAPSKAVVSRGPGQWVFVRRRFAGTGQGHVTRCRWTGPGLVLMQSGHTVWVSMRARLLKYNSDQLRPASHDEAIGAELQKSGDIKELLDQASSHRAGAVDVSSLANNPLYQKKLPRSLWVPSLTWLRLQKRTKEKAKKLAHLNRSCGTFQFHPLQPRKEQPQLLPCQAPPQPLHCHEFPSEPSDKSLK